MFVEVGQKKIESSSFLCLIVVIELAVVLSASREQAINYLVPALPAFYVVSALGYYHLSKLMPRRIGFLLLLVPAFFQFSVSYSWSDKYCSYFSSVSGGIESAMAKSLKFDHSGQSEAVDYLLSELERGEQEINVIVPRESQKLFKADFFRRDVVVNKDLFQFHSSKDHRYSDYLIEINALETETSHKYSEPLVELFSFELSGTSLVRVFKIPLPELPMEVDVSKGNHNTGEVRFFEQTKQISKADISESSVKAIVAIPGKSEKGFLGLGYVFKLLPRESKATFRLGIPKESLVGNYDRTRAAVKLQFLSCEKFITEGELSDKKMTDIELECKGEDSQGPVPNRLSVYWFGKTPVVFGGIVVE